MQLLIISRIIERSLRTVRGTPTLTRLAIGVLLAAMLALGSPAHAQNLAKPGAEATTQTIAPAEAKPTPDTSGTDAMTQTVLVDDSRSESDGMASASTTTAKAPVKKAAAKKKGKK